ncbi:MAG: hypothetical protein K8J31_12420, partial [Anaerolineae bacterium]|nr:hypothetical protein [Anaerolineae bacterium]
MESIDVIGQDAVRAGVLPEIEAEDIQLEVATQWRLMWWKFRKHHLAMLGATVVIAYYFVAIFAEFFAPTLSTTYLQDYVYAPPQPIQLFRDGRFDPYVNGYGF